jgi:hypothetical protein
MAASRPCEQCKTVKRCSMFIEERISAAYPGGESRVVKAIVYLCAPCARELGFSEA